MKIARLTVHPYRLPLREPLRLVSAVVQAREGVLVRAEAESGAIGWGDAAPLPGFSRESLDDVRRELARCATDAGAWTAVRGGPFLDAFASLLSGCSSSTRFAVESALASAAAAEAGVSLGCFLLGREADRCAVNALLASEPEAWAERARALAASGFSVIKLKVGRFPMALELACFRAAVEAAPDVRWRLDANRAWSALIARGFAQEVEGLPIDYVEEPVRAGVAQPEEWPDAVAVAWDETLQEHEPPPVAPGPVKVWVLKPTLAGGLARAIRLAGEASRRGLAIVFSSAYESGVGVRVLAELAAATGGVAGLDTYRVLAEDVLTPGLVVSAGAMDVRAARSARVEFKEMTA